MVTLDRRFDRDITGNELKRNILDMITPVVLHYRADIEGELRGHPLRRTHLRATRQSLAVAGAFAVSAR